MENAKIEFLKTCEDKILICATLSFGRDYIPEELKTFCLKKGHTPEQYEKFLSDINQDYDDGYGGQELYGTIWFKNGYWAERGEYDGSEWWEVKKYPQIPKELK